VQSPALNFPANFCCNCGSTDCAHELQDTGVAALKAIDAKDTEALSSAGGDIDMACETCHTKYWYPNKKAS